MRKLQRLFKMRMSHRQREQVKVEHAQCQVRTDHPLAMVDLFCDDQARLCTLQRVRIGASWTQAEPPYEQYIGFGRALANLTSELECSLALLQHLSQTHRNRNLR